MTFFCGLFIGFAVGVIVIFATLVWVALAADTSPEEAEYWARIKAANDPLNFPPLPMSL